MDFQNLEKTLLKFLKQNLSKTGKKNLVIGLSGGLDSAVVSTLCNKIAKTYAIILPTNLNQNLDDAINHALKFGIEYKIINIKSMLESYPNQNLTNHRRGNIISRLRMLTLFDLSEELNAVVVGTSNLSERLLGYSTIYGDSAYAFNPIGELFKTEIFEFAKFLNINENIINKKPSADLFEGQSDESDLGYSYEELDFILKEIYDNKKSFKELEKIYDNNLVKFIENKMKKNSFKLKMPEIAKVRS